MVYIRSTDDRPYEACVIGVTLTSILIHSRRGGHWPPVEKMQKWATDDRPYEAYVIGVTLTSILIYFRRGGHWPPVEKMQKWATNDCPYEWISRIKGSP